MVHFYVDDGLHAHPKARRVPLSAMGLWVMAGSWSADQLTEGHVPDWFVNGFGNAGNKAAEALVIARLWRPFTHKEYGPGFQFHDWARINTKTKAVVEAERAANAERQKRLRNKQSNASSNGVTNTVDNGVSNDTQSSPVHVYDDQDLNMSGRSNQTEDRQTGNWPAQVERIIELIRDECGRTIDQLGAAAVILHIDKRRGPKSDPIKSPLSYFTTTIHKHSFEFQQFVDEEGLAL